MDYIDVYNILYGLDMGAYIPVELIHFFGKQAILPGQLAQFKGTGDITVFKSY